MGRIMKISISRSGTNLPTLVTTILSSKPNSLITDLEDILELKRDLSIYFNLVAKGIIFIVAGIYLASVRQR